MTAVHEGPVLEIEHLVVGYRVRGGGVVQAVADVSLDVRRGEILGVVGESGCGKSTLAKTVVMLKQATSGSIRFAGEDLGSLSPAAARQLRPRMQMIFQDPISSLNPRRRVQDLVAEGKRIWGSTPTRQEVDTMLEAVGLDPATLGTRRAHQLSGGQCQRVAIARALMLEPELVVCDEPVSALDVSVQAQILNLLLDIRDRFGLTLLFIAHDLGVVRHVSDRVAVMYLGTICEVGPAAELFDDPLHPYTAALAEAIPSIDPEVELSPMPLRGEAPSPLSPPSGCRFRTRCPAASERCAIEAPTVRTIDGRSVACHHPLRAIDGDA